MAWRARPALVLRHGLSVPRLVEVHRRHRPCAGDRVLRGSGVDPRVEHRLLLPGPDGHIAHRRRHPSDGPAQTLLDGVRRRTARSIEVPVIDHRTPGAAGAGVDPRRVRRGRRWHGDVGRVLIELAELEVGAEPE